MPNTFEQPFHQEPQEPKSRLVASIESDQDGGGGSTNKEFADIELSTYKLPNNVELREKEVYLKENSGEFHMPLEMFKLYIKHYSIKPKDFRFLITYYVKEDTFDKNPASIETRRKTREFLISKGLKPEDYLSKYGDSTEKTSELEGVIPKELMDEIMFQRLLYYFSSHSANDRHTFFEHRTLGSSSSQFFERPFMGGFKADPAWQQETTTKRKEDLKIASRLSSQALILFTNSKNYDYGGPGQDYAHVEAGSKELGQQVRQKLKLLYESTGDVPVPFEEIDYARVVLKPAQYDKNMEAIPKPIRLEFLRDKKVVVSVNEPSLLKVLKPKREDFKLAGTLEDSTGKKRSIQMKTKGFIHTLSFADKEIPDWYNSYLERVSTSK